MRSNLITFLTYLSFCGCTFEKESSGTLFLSNISQDYFDSATFNILIDNKLIVTDTVKNIYVSSHWEEKTINIPKQNFNLRVSIHGKGYTIEKDTAIASRDSLKVFIRFDFYPYYKRYHNPEIFKHLLVETTNLKAIADSLYRKNLLPNAAEYLNDTIPLKKNIEIMIK